MTCIAVDDEPLALALLEDNISKLTHLQLVRKCQNAFEAIEVMNSEKIDLIFLDIQMPGLTGIQFLQSMSRNKPMVIFVTAYEKYALDGYALNVVDYLLKPVAFERFVQAVQKAKDLFDLRLPSPHETTTEVADFFFVNAEYSLVKVEIPQILYIEGMKDYLKIFLINQPKPVITRMSFKAMEEKLPSERFMRLHKSYLTNIYKIDVIRNGFAFIGEKAIPIGESQRDDLLRVLGI